MTSPEPAGGRPVRKATLPTITDVPDNPTLAEAADYLTTLGKRLQVELTVQRAGSAWIVTNHIAGKSRAAGDFAGALADATGITVVADIPRA